MADIATFRFEQTRLSADSHGFRGCTQFQRQVDAERLCDLYCDTRPDKSLETGYGDRNFIWTCGQLRKCVIAGIGADRREQSPRFQLFSPNSGVGNNRS